MHELCDPEFDGGCLGRGEITSGCLDYMAYIIHCVSCEGLQGNPKVAAMDRATRGFFIT